MENARYRELVALLYYSRQSGNTSHLLLCSSQSPTTRYQIYRSTPEHLSTIWWTNQIASWGQHPNIQRNFVDYGLRNSMISQFNAYYAVWKVYGLLNSQLLVSRDGCDLMKCSMWYTGLGCISGSDENDWQWGAHQAFRVDITINWPSAAPGPPEWWPACLFWSRPDTSIPLVHVQSFPIDACLSNQLSYPYVNYDINWFDGFSARAEVV